MNSSLLNNLKNLKRILLKCARILSVSNLYQHGIFLLRGKRMGNTLFGKGFECLGRKGLSLGKNVEIGNRVRFQSARGIDIGASSYIGHGNHLYGHIRIGEYFMSGPNVSMMAGDHGFEKNDIPMALQPTISKGGIKIGDDVWIGTNSVLLDGIIVGDHVIIAAGSVVTKNLDSWGIYGGNPAKLLKSRKQ